MLNCENAYKEMKVPKDKEWKSVYLVIGGEGAYTEIIAYGKDEETSLKNCKNLFKYLQTKYNVEDEYY